MKIYLTKNVRKEDDYVNGMMCIVEGYFEQSGMLRVKTSSGHRLAITPWTDVERGKAVYYPLRIGYASTIHKAQGGEFKHITVWLDVPNMPATGYTALSRVARGSDYLLGGWVEAAHFTPVN
jgi:ATP-dependent exoDNAse (exonuclease V) alpha subunit